MKRVGAEHSDRHARQGLMKPPRKRGLSCSQDFSVDGDVPDPFTERDISLRSRLAEGKTKSHTKSKIIIDLKKNNLITGNFENPDSQRCEEQILSVQFFRELDGF